MRDSYEYFNINTSTQMGAKNTPTLNNNAYLYIYLEYHVSFSAKSKKKEKSNLASLISHPKK